MKRKTDYIRSILFSRYPFLEKMPLIKTTRVDVYGRRIVLLSVGVVLILQSTSIAAPDLTDTWDFSNPSDYVLDDGIEISSGVARLKAQNYLDDASTAALYHFDEVGGANVTDSSSNGNDGILDGGSFVSGNLNNAVALNGVSDGITVSDSPSLRLGQNQSIEAWTKFPNAFNNVDQARRNQIVDKGDYQLYYNNETGKLTYELANANVDTWTQEAGNSLNGSWDYNGKRSVNSLIKVGSEMYAAIGIDTGDASVWRFNGSEWSQVGGGVNSINNSWDAQTYEGVFSLATDGTNVFAGLGRSTGDAEVWQWDGTTWTKIGGDSLNGGWTNYAEQIWTMDFLGGSLYIGLGSSANDAEVWQWDGTTWTKIGGDSLNGGWTTNYEYVASLTNDGTNLFAGLGASSGDSEVWQWDGTTWTKIGGDTLNASWGGTIEAVISLRHFGGNLYAGLGNGTDDAEVWRYDGVSWSQIGGDGLNSSWPSSTYEQVTSLAYDGSNIYAGLGTGNGDGEVWRYDGVSWSQIGGDGLNNGWITNWGDIVNTLLWDSGRLYAGLYDSAGTGWVYEWDGSSWGINGGNYVNKSWGYYGLDSVQVMQAFGDYLYAGMGNGSGEAQVWRFDGTSWEIVGGQGINNSWAPNTFEFVLSMASYKGNLYVGLGNTASGNDGQVWRFDGTSWQQVGGQGLNNSWPSAVNQYGEVNSLASDVNYLYAGLGIAANNGEVWRYDGTAWEQIGGDSLNGGWTNYAESIYALAIYKGNLVAGLGRGGGDSEVWEWDGTTWTKIGGDNVNSSWSGQPSVESLIVYNNELYAGLGYATGNATLWKYDGSAWTEVAGDDINGSWTTGTYERVRTLAVYNGQLYVGLGSSTGDGEVWLYDGVSWEKIGGNGINSGWAGTIEEINSFSSYKGKMYAGTGISGNADAAVWSWGDNLYLESNIDSFDTDWHHVAVTYDGSVARMYIDGVLDASAGKAITVATSARPLLIGLGYGGREYGKPEARLNGELDELRLSSSTRTEFTTTPYASQPQTVSLSQNARPSGLQQWDTLSDTQLPGGGTITYRLSNDGGNSWVYWDGLAWSTSNDLSQANTTAIITANFSSFPITFQGLRWQAIFSGNGFERVSLDGVSAEATSDTTEPSANPTAIEAYTSNGGSQVFTNDWTNGSSPYFSWDAGSDAASGVYGYCAYLGTDNSADPVTTKGILGTSPADGSTHCPFVVPNTELDLATVGILGAPLVSSNDPYFLILKTIDRAGNVTSSSTQFNFRFDNEAPQNPGFISAPAGFINTKDVELTWDTVGGSAASDNHSGVVGLHYRIGLSGIWYGDSHTGTGDATDLLINDGAYNTVPTPDHNDLVEGVNTVYFRTWDAAGNYTTSYVTATIKINTSGTPSEPTNLVANPTSNTQNSFAFDWDAPSTFVGDVGNITYCYTINAVPTNANCVYTAAGSTELTLGPYATQPGNNTLYVVARDESSNINYASYASVVFTANTTAPGIPLNTDIVDVSIKSTNNWRLAVTWDEPSTTGEGIASYRVFRSTDNSNFAQVGSSTSTTYIDAGLSQQTYYYYITACDSTNNCGAKGLTVSELPTGKFTEPATLVGEPKVSGITTRRASINWTTNRTSDSKIAIGTKSGQYGSSEIGSSEQVSDHTIELDNLAPGTTYYFIAKWTDEDGNTGTSQEYTFTTSPAPIIKEVTVSNVNLNGATVTFTTKGASRAIIYYGASESFGGFKEINTSVIESRYEVRLNDLTDGTKYFFMVSAIDDEEAEYRGNIDSFTTPPSPRIFNLRFEPVEGEPTSTQLVSWETNVPATSQVAYAVVNGALQEIQNSELKTEHEIIIQNLLDDSDYTLVAQSRDADGNVAVSDRQTFRTALDTRPPKISDIVVESSVRGSGSEARGQIVVSWRTDEPSTSQVAYTEGSDAEVFNSKTAEDSRLTTEHIVIISSLPTSRVFSIQPISADASGNEGFGDSQTVIIGRASDSALTVVFNTLRSLFGF